MKISNVTRRPAWVSQLVGSRAHGGGGGGGAGAIHLDTTATLYRTAPLSGAANSPNGTYFVWFRQEPGWLLGGSNILLVNNAAGNGGLPDSAAIYNYLFISPNTGGENVVYTQLTDEDYLNDIGAFCGTDVSDGNWHLWAISWQTNHAAGQRIVQMLFNGVLQTVTIDFEDGGAFDVVWDELITIGRSGFQSNGDPGSPLNQIDLSDQYLNPLVAVDLSSPSVVAKIIDGNGKPVSLGSDGSLLTGSVPTGGFYLSGDASTYQNNLAGTGAFSVYGTLTNATTSPSD